MATDNGGYDVAYVWDSPGGMKLLGWASSVFNQKRLQRCSKAFPAVYLQAPIQSGELEPPCGLVGCNTRGEELPELSPVCPPAGFLQKVRRH